MLEAMDRNKSLKCRFNFLYVYLYTKKKNI